MKDGNRTGMVYICKEPIPTPRTDAEAAVVYKLHRQDPGGLSDSEGGLSDWVSIESSRQLERELATMQKENDQLRRQLALSQDADVMSVSATELCNTAERSE